MICLSKQSNTPAETSQFLISNSIVTSIGQNKGTFTHTSTEQKTVIERRRWNEENGFCENEFTSIYVHFSEFWINYAMS